MDNVCRHYKPIDMKTSLAERRQWFDCYLQRIEQGQVDSPRLGARYPCPCCGYPTLEMLAHWEICDLCSWEDDGQDDPHADDVWGGPNYDLSLSQARRNFELYLDKYPPDQANYIGGPDSKVELAAKSHMIAAFDDMIGQTDPTTMEALWERVYRAQVALEQELRLKLSPKDQRFLRHLRRFHEPTKRPK
jgi:hypothetical protein